MKKAFLLTLAIAMIAAIILTVAYFTSEPEWLDYATLAFLIAPIPFLLFLIYKLMLAAVKGIAELASASSAAMKRSAESRAARKAAMPPPAPKVPAHEAPTRIAAPSLHPTPAPAVLYGTPKEPLNIPTGRGVRFGLAIACILVFLVLPQFQLFVNLNGFQIMKLVFDKAKDGGMTSIPAAFLLCLVVQAGFSWMNDARDERWIGCVSLFLLGLTVFNLSHASKPAPDPDNPFAEGLGKLVENAVGFTWGFYVTVVCTLAFTAAAFIEQQKRKQLIAYAPEALPA